MTFLQGLRGPAPRSAPGARGRGWSLAVVWLVAACAPAATLPPAPLPPATLEQVLDPGGAWPEVDGVLRSMLRQRGERATVLLPAEGESYRCEFDGPRASLTCDGVTRTYASVEELLRQVGAGHLHRELALGRLADEGALRARGVPVEADSVSHASADTVSWTVLWLDEAGVRKRHDPLVVPVAVTVRARGAIEAVVQLEGEPRTLAATSTAGFLEELKATLAQHSARASARRRDGSLGQVLDALLAPLSWRGSRLAYADLAIGTTRRQLEERYRLSPPNFDAAGRREWLGLGAGRCPDCSIRGITRLNLVDRKLVRLRNQRWVSREQIDERSAGEMCQALEVEFRRRLDAGLARVEGETCAWRRRVPGGRVELSWSGDHVEVEIESSDYAEVARGLEHAMHCQSCRRLRPGHVFDDVGIVRSIDLRVCTMTLEASGPALSAAGRDGELSVEPCRDKP